MDWIGHIYETILNSAATGEPLSTTEIISIAKRLGVTDEFAIRGLNYAVKELLETDTSAEQDSLVETIRQAIRTLATS
ncbi:MAG: hypothetical protein RI895_660 [Actinomycetota bacterium]|jgi:hypothetical protein